MRLKLYRPVRTYRITQGWGENRHPYYRSVGMKGHNGIDFAAWHGEDVYHSGNYDGWMKVEKDFHGGIGVDVVSNGPVQLDDGYVGYVKLRYWHLKSAIGHDGKQVKLGDIIGLADNTGVSSGDHVHYALKKCDKDGEPLGGEPGFNGCINPTSYLDVATTARTAAERQGILKQVLTEQERKEMYSQLTVLQSILKRLRR